MPRHVTSPSAGGTVVDKLKTYEGGTGQTSAAAALAALGAVPLATKNQPNGVAGLDAQSKLPAALLPLDNMSVISVIGPASLVKGQSANYVLSNYDAFTTYEIVPVSGTVVRVNDTINYSAPATPGAGGFTINGRLMDVVIGDYAPRTPTLAAVDNGSGSGVVMTLTADSFLMMGNSDTHLNTDWQIATDNAFTNIVSQSMADATNKTTWTSGMLNLSTTYYARCRYRSSGNFVSAWSNVQTRTTKSSYSLSVEEAILTYPAINGGSGQFGAPSSNVFSKSIAISADGSRVAIGNTYDALSGFSNIGSVYVFVRTGSNWQLEQRILPPSYNVPSVTGDDRFGASISMSDDGTRLVIGAPGTYNTTDTNGAAFVFLRTNSTWDLEQKVTGSSTSGANFFAESVAISGDGTRFAAYDYAQSTLRVYLRTGTTWAFESSVSTSTTGGFTPKMMALTANGDRMVVGSYDHNSYVGAACVLVRSGSTWSLEQTLAMSPAAVQFDCYGISVAITSDGTRCVVSANNNYTGSEFRGKAAVFRRSGSTWTQEAILQDVALSVGSLYSKCVDISADGALIAISAPDRTGGNPTKGNVYTYRRNNTTWTQDSKVTGSLGSNGNRFGFSMALAKDGSRFCGVQPGGDRAFVFTH